MANKLPPGQPIRIEPVKYWWREWYTKVTEDTGRIVHYGPWNSRWAAEICAAILVKYPRRHIEHSH